MLTARQPRHIANTVKLNVWLILFPLIILLSCTYSFGSYGGSCTPTKLKLGGRLTAPYHTESGEGLVDQHLQLIFEGLNCQLELQTIPSERALRAANRGQLDGDFVQLDNLDTTMYSNLLRVMPSYFSFFMAYVSLEQVTYVDDLSDYRIGAMTGMPLSAEALNNVRIVRTKSYDQLMTLSEVSPFQ